MSEMETAEMIVKGLTREWLYVRTFQDGRAVAMTADLLGDVLSLIASQQYSEAVAMIGERDSEVLVTTDWIKQVKEQEAIRRCLPK